MPWLSEFEVASLLRYDGALVLRGQLWNKFCDKSASFLGVEITNLLRNINKGSDHLEMVKSMQRQFLNFFVIVLIFLRKEICSIGGT